jgi:hypothetical protein
VVVLVVAVVARAFLVVEAADCAYQLLQASSSIHILLDTFFCKPALD